jgi:NADH:ubiquinone oxidoreductase subunit E
MQLTVCVGSCCYSKGAQDIIDYIKEKHPEIELKGAFCMGACAQGVTISYNGNISQISSPEDIEFIIEVSK